VPVLILGEPGTGKELVAKIIHHLGEQKEEVFRKIDCKFLTEETLRDHLHRILKEVGDTDQRGTLYLKEVGFLEEKNQLQILELLEDLIFQTTMEGSASKTPRFISSSSENLEAKVAQGRFSEDLYDG
jgi:two-component system response regulator HydG